MYGRKVPDLELFTVEESKSIKSMRLGRIRELKFVDLNICISGGSGSSNRSSTFPPAVFGKPQSELKKRERERERDDILGYVREKSKHSISQYALAN